MSRKQYVVYTTGTPAPIPIPSSKSLSQPNTRVSGLLHPSSPRHEKGIRRKQDLLPLIGRYFEVPCTKVHIKTEGFSPLYLSVVISAFGEIYIETCFEAVSFNCIHTNRHARKPFFGKKKSSRSGRFPIPHLLNPSPSPSSPWRRPKVQLRA